MSLRTEVVTLFNEVAEEHGKLLVPLSNETPLLNSGLDSLCLAVIVARLEDSFGFDPFSSNEDAAFPVTIGDFIKLYEDAAESRGIMDSAPALPE